jgi:NitT/TauT family transport system permease protein
VIQIASVAAFVGLLVLLAAGSVGLVKLFMKVDGASWRGIGLSASLTLGRVLLATAAGTLWTVPAGLAIGLSPRLSRVLQPVVQVVASFPAPMLFPAVVAILAAAGVGLGWGSVLLMLLGTQWYILFNVIAGAAAIPGEMRHVATNLRVSGWLWWRRIALPAVFPYYVTGALTASGGSWNASIVAEVASWGDEKVEAAGLGAYIANATGAGDFHRIVLGVVTMSLYVLLINRLLWRPLYYYAERKFRLS